MRANQALERVQRESTRVVDARNAFAVRAGRIHPLVLTGSALVVGLVAGRLLGRPRLPRALAPSSLLANALQRPLTGLLEQLVKTFLSPAASGDSRSGIPPETRSPTP